MLVHTKEQYFEHLGIKTKLFTHFSFQVIDHLQDDYNETDHHDYTFTVVEIFKDKDV